MTDKTKTVDWHLQRVLVELPAMQSPFKNCAPFKRATTKTRSLTLNFSNEDEDVTVANARTLLGRITAALKVANGGGKIEPIIKQSIPKPPDFVQYDDSISAKFQPGAVSFQSASGYILDESKIDFSKVEVQAVVWVKSLNYYQGKYYPRLELVYATVYCEVQELESYLYTV